MNQRTLSFTILGEAASKANSRRLVMFGRRPRSIKSEKALNFVKAVRQQMPAVTPPLALPIEAHIKIFYRTRRPDLDESALLDALQWSDKDGLGVIINDRQIRRKYVEWGIDETNPRCEITLTENQALDPVVKRGKRKGQIVG